MAFRVEVRSLFDSLSASRTVSGEFVVPDIELGQQPYRFDGPATFEVTLTNVGAGIIAQGTVNARVHTPCVRCLCETCVDIHADIDGFYVLPGHEDEIPEEQEYEIIEDGLTVDLEPALVQTVVVELPFAPVHDAECKGICPVCGADRNVMECGCESPGTSSAFDVLKDLHLGDEGGA